MYRLFAHTRSTQKIQLSVSERAPSAGRMDILLLTVHRLWMQVNGVELMFKLHFYSTFV